MYIAKASPKSILQEEPFAIVFGRNAKFLAI